MGKYLVSIGKPIFIWSLFVIVAYISVGRTVWAEASSDEEEPQSTIVYVSLDPPLITNYQHSRLRYLKAELSVKASNQLTADALEHHKPEIRHKLLLLLSEYDMSTLTVVDKRDAIRDRAKQVIRDTLEEEGVPALVEEVLFVNFIVE